MWNMWKHKEPLFHLRSGTEAARGAEGLGIKTVFAQLFKRKPAKKIKSKVLLAFPLQTSGSFEGVSCLEEEEEVTPPRSLVHFALRRESEGLATRSADKLMKNMSDKIHGYRSG
ncbi:hypothetical protein EYF80_002261 [Liparis tanakae]|uniref:Uncharacterized protein n=1 Tax=Liparis tanakae TaxID=230148 RepID=A0A4Z2JCI5_9TELE|nr:hypothetical protein EYF80_002261 [Liparis tanakae]